MSILLCLKCDFTWNWALMLGGFFFLCRWSRDLVVRSCSVRLTMNFRDWESSKFYVAVIQWINILLVLLFYTLFMWLKQYSFIWVFGFYLGLPWEWHASVWCSCFSCGKGRKNLLGEFVLNAEAGGWTVLVDGVWLVRTVDFFMRCQSEIKTTVAPGRENEWWAEEQHEWVTGEKDDMKESVNKENEIGGMK